MNEQVSRDEQDDPLAALGCGVTGMLFVTACLAGVGAVVKFIELIGG